MTLTAERQYAEKQLIIHFFTMYLILFPNLPRTQNLTMEVHPETPPLQQISTVLGYESRFFPIGTKNLGTPKSLIVLTQKLFGNNVSNLREDRIFTIAWAKKNSFGRN